MATDPKTGVVEDMVYINGSEITYISGAYRERFTLVSLIFSLDWNSFVLQYALILRLQKRPFVYKNISDVKVLMYVRTAMDEKMNGIDNQIYYGKPHGVDFQELYKDGGKPLQELGDSPFQIHGFSVLYQEFTKERSQLVELFRAGSRFKEDCSAFDEKQWIANHGLYRVCHNKILDWPTFENVYYMPWVGSYFEAKCLSE